MSKHWGIWVGWGWVKMGGKGCEGCEGWVRCVGYMGGVGRVN